jgi:nuclear transport factor 2 (NTF2) superfamily protein
MRIININASTLIDDPEGIMHHRHASINDVRIAESERLFHSPRGVVQRITQG